MKLKPSILYRQNPGGSRQYIGEAYTLDAASEAVADDDWPADCLPVLVEPDGTELQLENGEWIAKTPVPPSIIEARARSARNLSAARAREHARVLRSAVAVLDALAQGLTFATPELKRTRNFLTRLAGHLEES